MAAHSVRATGLHREYDDACAVARLAIAGATATGVAQSPKPANSGVER